MSVSDLLEVWPPQGCELLMSFDVHGMPRPAGSKNAIPVLRKNKETGRKVPVTKTTAKGDVIPVFNVADSSGELGENWRGDIRTAAAQQLDAAHDLHDGPIAVRVTFAYAGPASRWGTGRNAGVLKANADRYPRAGELADGTKLARALEDALNALVWTDDRRVCELWWSRAFSDQLTAAMRARLGDGPGAAVDIFALPVPAKPEPEPAQGTLLASP